MVTKSSQSRATAARFRRCAVVAGAALLSACGTGAVAQAVRPADPTAAQALGSAPASSPAACAEIEAAGEPLIVDWSPDQRVDLEVAVKQGLPIVKYTCHTLQVLKGCSVDAGYAYKGVTPEEQVVRLMDGDEVRANLPFSGATIAAGLDRGQTLDIGLAYIGKNTSTVRAVPRSKLSGECDGATHFVHATTVGAFAMRTGTRANVSTAAQIFGTGAEAGSASSRTTTVTDGNLDACLHANPDADAPPAECRSILRLELWKIDADAATAEQEPVCGHGLVLSDGKCARPDAVATHVCQWPASLQDQPDCATQCANGDGTSCYRLGRALLNRDPAVSENDFATACDKDVADGCQWAGLLLGTGRFAPAVPADQAKAVAFYQRGCDRGSADACFDLGSKYQLGLGVAKDEAKAAQLYAGACNAGNAMACVNLGWMAKQGIAVPKDALRAATLFARACDAGGGIGAARGCALLADMLEAGEGVAKDDARAKTLYGQACDWGAPSACAKRGP
jgi:TPR repeat protein